MLSISEVDAQKRWAEAMKKNVFIMSLNTGKFWFNSKLSQWAS